MNAEDDGTGEAAAKGLSDEMSAFTDGVRAAEGTTAWSKDGGGGDVTEVVPGITQAAPTELAWSNDDETAEDDETRPWREALAGAAPVVFIVAVVALVLSVVGFVWVEHHSRQGSSAAPSMALPNNPNWTPPPSASPAPAPPARPTLDGAYQLVFNVSAATYRGSAVPPKRTGTKTIWWAFRSSCTSAGCTASGVKLDDTDHSVRSAKNITDTFTYTDGQWEDAAMPVPADIPGCDTATNQWTLRPQPDGTLAGVETVTVDSSCPSTGNGVVTPFTAARIGPVPAGLLGTTEVN